MDGKASAVIPIARPVSRQDERFALPSQLGSSDGYRQLVSLSACPVPMLASYRPHPDDDAVATFTPRLTAVMLVTEARGTDESNSPKRVSGACHQISWVIQNMSSHRVKHSGRLENRTSSFPIVYARILFRSTHMLRFL